MNRSHLRMGGTGGGKQDYWNFQQGRRANVREVKEWSRNPTPDSIIATDGSLRGVRQVFRVWLVGGAGGRRWRLGALV